VALVVLGGLGAVAVAAYGIADHLLNVELRSRFDRELEALAGQVEVTYDGFHYNLFTRRGEARGITATTADGNLRFLVDRLVVHRMERDAATDVLAGLRLTGHGVRWRDRTEDGGYVPGFADLGYSDPRMEFSVDQAFDPGTQVLTLREVTVSGEGMGRLRLSGKLSGLKGVDVAGLTSPNWLEVAVAAGNLQFHGADASYRDAGLAERMLARREKNRNETREAIVAGVAKGMREQKFFRFSEEMIGEVSSFLAAPSGIGFRAEPAQPVGKELIGMTLLFRGNLLQLFGVTIHQEKKS
jgi:hypothetical protein